MSQLMLEEEEVVGAVSKAIERAKTCYRLMTVLVLHLIESSFRSSQLSWPINLRTHIVVAMCVFILLSSINLFFHFLVKIYISTRKKRVDVCLVDDHRVISF